MISTLCIRTFRRRPTRHRRPEWTKVRATSACGRLISDQTSVSKTVILGVLDLSDHRVEPVEVVVQRVRRVLPHIDVERLVLAPDCGMKYLPRASAEGKLRSMTEAARLLRTELGA